MDPKIGLNLVPNPL